MMSSKSISRWLLAGIVMIILYSGFRASRKKENEFTVAVKSFEGDRKGYQVFKDGKLLIEQPGVPGVSGNTGFASAEEAEKVAGLVLHKLEAGVFPPTVSPSELDSLGITY